MQPGVVLRSLRVAAALAALLLLGACGFQLRGSHEYPFSRIAIMPQTGSPVASEIMRYLPDMLAPISVPKPPEGAVPDPNAVKPAQVILDILMDQREKVVVGYSATGIVREYELRMRVLFRVRTPQGQELIEPSEIVEFRPVSFNPSAALAYDAEDALEYRNMQSDIAQQILRRLATVRLP